MVFGYRFLTKAEKCGENEIKEKKLVIVKVAVKKNIIGRYISLAKVDRYKIRV